MGCEQRYPVRMGIPDLRWPRPVDDRDTVALTAELMRRYSADSLDDLVTLEIESLTAPSRLKEGYLVYRLEAVERGRRFERMFQDALRAHFRVPGYEAAVDLGCGSGASLPSLAADFRCVYGVDPYLPDLVLARKLCEEYDLGNVFLVQALGQNLPFESDVLDYVRALNVIEHLFDVDRVFQEIVRCLRSMGCFCGDSRNRYDPFLPEPHVRLRWVGFLPRRLMPVYVRIFRRAEYKGVHLLSLAELRQHLRRAFGSRFAVALAKPSAYGYAPRLDRLVAELGRRPLLGGLVFRVFPSYLALAQSVSQYPE